MKPRAVDTMRRAYQAMGTVFSVHKVEITLPQAAVLRALLELGPSNQRKITEATAVDRSTLVDVLRRLAKGGMVVAVRNENDARANLVSLTPAGRAALGKAEAALDKAETAIMAAIPRAERRPFLESLDAISRMTL